MSEEQDESSKRLQSSLDKLANWENQMSEIERDAEIYRIKATQKMYEERRKILKTIPKFWYIILAENDDFADYVSVEDLKYLEYIEDIYVYYPVVDDSANHYKDFSITISFGENELVPKQEVTKHFKVVMKDGEERLVSEPVEFQWPEELKNINPNLIKDENKGKPLSKEDKKNYRLGMKSFFSWFNWTGEKPGKEFRNGEDLANLIVDDLYLNALKYYILALTIDDGDDDDQEEEDSSEGEELDLSEDEDNTKKRSLDEDDDTQKNTNKKSK
ncbi:uncharacterized protein J8A68_004869 [[Candida] subhashii]|uniref:Vacuolar protein sorting-associated protein 75 n=1 Tax=[Candida] subhashii TaxID=561895 RepID=A0A8J5QI79_9ASCO|nr:uncharacterized protein J8A68_004869 [[Candida] subhashii]KAG7661601.1 hypothetical protein J8A68_004869 [[Candida] subhashii]